MPMILCVSFNNRDWKDQCINADSDERLFRCMENKVATGYKVDKKTKKCTAKCWESYLCRGFRWESHQGNFNKEKYKGDVFFFYDDVDRKPVFFGKSKIKKIEGKFIYFNKFKPVPEDKRVKIDFSKIFGKWKRTYRSIDNNQARKLEKMIKDAQIMQKRVSKKDIQSDTIFQDITDEEGRRVLREHIVRERSAKLVKEFKKSLQSLNCWVCGFNFQEAYGEIGRNFIEAHHKKPLSSTRSKRETSIKDFIPVCSNCHKMIHRKSPMIRWEELKDIVSKRRKRIGN